MNNNVEGTIKIGTFFSGIGAPEKALEKLKTDGKILNYKIMFFSEINKSAIKSYCAVHNVNEKLNLGDIRNVNGKSLPYCDLWVGGFPCQDISISGKLQGFDKKTPTRSSLGWEMIRLLKEIQSKPKYVIFENVPNVTSERFSKVLNSFKKELEKLGYHTYENILCATDFKIPQKRRRYFLVAILDKTKTFEFPDSINNNVVLKDILETEVDSKYYLSDNQFTMNETGDRVYKNKDKDDILYTVNMDKYVLGKRCGTDEHCNWKQASRIYSELGVGPTLTASNTSGSYKILVAN